MKEQIPLTKLTIEHIKAHVKAGSYMLVHNPDGELFQHPKSEDVPENCLLIDLFSASAIVKIYDALKPSNQAKFNSLLQSEYNFASFLDGMWKFIKVA